MMHNSRGNNKSGGKGFIRLQGVEAKNNKKKKLQKQELDRLNNEKVELEAYVDKKRSNPSGVTINYKKIRELNKRVPHKTKHGAGFKETRRIDKIKAKKMRSVEAENQKLEKLRLAQYEEELMDNKQKLFGMKGGRKKRQMMEEIKRKEEYLANLLEE